MVRVSLSSLVDINCIAGKLDSKYNKIIIDWLEKNQLALLELWNEVQKGNNKEYELIIKGLKG